jgi:hypothetical protein
MSFYAGSMFVVYDKFCCRTVNSQRSVSKLEEQYSTQLTTTVIVKQLVTSARQT